MQFHGLNPTAVLRAHPEAAGPLSSAPQFLFALAHFQPNFLIRFRSQHLLHSLFALLKFGHLLSD